MFELVSCEKLKKSKNQLTPQGGIVVGGGFYKRGFKKTNIDTNNVSFLLSVNYRGVKKNP